MNQKAVASDGVPAFVGGSYVVTRDGRILSGPSPDTVEPTGLEGELLGVLNGALITSDAVDDGLMIRRVYLDGEQDWRMLAPDALSATYDGDTRTVKAEGVGDDERSSTPSPGPRPSCPTRR